MESFTISPIIKLSNDIQPNMSLGTLLYTWFFGNFVGSDELSNKYYCNLKDFQDKKAKRWVIFSGEIEASKIPPHWHAWLHKTIDIPPINYKHKYDWQKNHQQNLTGTSKAYYPKPQISSKVIDNSKEEKEYERWKP